jgi:hypothetical protein
MNCPPDHVEEDKLGDGSVASAKENGNELSLDCAEENHVQGNENKAYNC